LLSVRQFLGGVRVNCFDSMIQLHFRYFHVVKFSDDVHLRRSDTKYSFAMSNVHHWYHRQFIVVLVLLYLVYCGIIHQVSTVMYRMVSRYM
jgi:hypothetical protein